MSDAITIRSVTNGAIVKWGDSEAAYTFDEEMALGLVEMLSELSEAFLPHNRHAEQQIAVHLIHGNKYECKGCDICKPDEPHEE